MKTNTIYCILLVVFISCAENRKPNAAPLPTTNNPQLAITQKRETTKRMHKSDSAVYAICYQPAEILLKQEMKNNKLNNMQKTSRLRELKRNHHFCITVKTRKKEIPRYFFNDFANDLVLTSGYDSIHPGFYLPVLSGNLKGGFDILVDFPVTTSTNHSYRFVVKNKQYNDFFISEFDINAINKTYESNVQL